MPATLQELETRLSELDSQMTAILDKAAADNGGHLSEEQREKFNALDAEYDEKLKAHQEWKADLERAAQLNDKRPNLSPLPRRTTPDPVPTGNDGAATDGKLATPWESFGEQLLGIHAMAISGHEQRPLSPDLLSKFAMLAPTGSSAGVDSDGGFLVQKDFSAELFRRTYETGALASRCRSIPIGATADGLKMNAVDETSRANGSRFGGIRAYWKAEAGQMTGSKPKLRQIELELQDLTGLWYATNRLLQDATALESIAMQAFPEEFAFVLDDAILNGDGAGKPLGVLNSPALVTVAKENNQAATTIKVQNLFKMWARCWARSRMNAVWFVNQDVETELYGLEFPVGTGGIPAFLPPGGLSQMPYSTLFGRPVIPVEHCPTLGTVGDIVLADMSQYLLINKGGIKSDSSIHLRFDYNETAFRWVMRANGQPLWNSALTPFKGSNTLSPFVALATRS